MAKDTGKKLADMMYGQNPEQAAFGFFPQMRPRRTRQDPEAAKNVPVDLARGFVAGTLGIPGDLESFARLPYELITGNESPTILPTSEQIEKRLPFGSDTPAGRAASGLGTLAGNFYTGAGSVPRAFGNVVKDVSGAISKARQPKAMPEVKIPDLPPSVTEPIEVKSIPTPYRTEQPQGLSYETRQEGPFYRVKPNLPEASARQDRGTKEGVGGAPAFIRSTGSDVPQPVTDEAVQAVMAKPDNFVRQVADEYSQKNTGEPYQLPQIPESSLLKQSPIGRVFDLAATDDPVYKKTVFDAYAKQYPQLVEQSGAQNYDQLMEASYRQLAKETEQQFRALPINMSYHRAGEGNYENSKELLRDIYGNRHMYVYQGGDPHDFLNAVDPATGLNTNEMFRAVHDFFGHAIHGNQFGPKGEEIAWAAHSKMFSPLARLAMTSETRGQNSFVNYTPLNAELKRNINELNGQLYEAKRRGNKAMVDEINKDLAEVWQGFQFAPQKSVILPPEFLDLKYSGGMPQYLQPLIKPKAGTTVASELTHFSPKEGLSTIDPRMFGTGIKGEEMQRLQGQPGAVMERSYFYTGDPTKATPEPGLGPYRYLGESSSLYDVAADPLKLRTLAAETQRIPYTSPINPGMVTGSPFTDVERLVKEYGYEGLVNPTLTKPSAVMFKPTPVRPFKKGGAVHISDNPDVMQLELAGGGAVAALKRLVRAPAKTKQEIEAVAERMAPQVTGEYVRAKPGSAVTVAGKTKKQFEREKTLPVDIRATAEERIPQPVDIEKLKGEVMIGIPGDPTVTGKTLYSVGETKLGSPAPQHGGPLYGLYHDDDHFWASGLGAARRVQNLAKEAAEQYDAPVVGKYIMMGPDSINYAQHFADANLQAIDLSKMSKKQIEQFNKLIRFGNPKSGPRPSFPGIEDKESAYLHMAMDPELRKHFNELMQKSTITEALNLPSGTDIRFAITEGPLRDLETGVTGYSIGRMKPEISAKELKLSEHPTYSHDIPGEFLGQSKYPIPYELSFPDTLKAIRENPKQAPHEFSSLKMVGPRQTIDQQLIDEIRAYEERMKQLTGKKAGGAARKAAGGEITADDLILEERKL